MPKILVLDELSQDGLDLLTSAGSLEVEVRTGLKGADLREALLAADGAICRSGVKITAEVLSGNTRLRAIARAGVGVDNIDTPAATRQGIVVMNTPGGNTVSTAEHTIALMLGMSRNIAPAYQSLIEGRWDRKKFMGAQLSGKTLGIIGLGRVGQAVAIRARGIEMRVLGYDPFLPAARAKELGIEPCESANEMLPLVDYLSVHTPLNDQTRNLIGSKEVQMLKRGARLINCARGGIFDETALAEGLKSGKIAGVALDVFAEEPCTTSPLFGLPGVLCTPHLGASTEEAQSSVAVEAAELLIDFFTTGVPADLFAGMAQMPKVIARAFKEPHAMGGGDGWSPPEVVAHLADIEVGLGWRIRQVLAEDEPMLQPFDQDRWAEALAYKERDLATSLAAYGANRQLNLEILRRAGDPGLQRIYRHPEFGTRPVQVLVEHIADHDLNHLRQIRGE